MKSLTFLLLVVVAMLLTDGSKNTTNTTDKVVKITWSKQDSLAYARDKLSEWRDKQWCLALASCGVRNQHGILNAYQ
jgi:hypothetical protein